MCGEIRKSPDAGTAVQWAIAYAKSFEDLDDGSYQRVGEALPDDSLRRQIAREFIGDHVPVAQRTTARNLLEAMPDPLDTAVSYWDTVVDQRVDFARALAISGSDVHDYYDNYDRTKADQPSRWHFDELESYDD